MMRTFLSIVFLVSSSVGLLGQEPGWYCYLSHQGGDGWVVKPGNAGSTLMAMGYNNRIDCRIVNTAGDSTTLLRFSTPLDIWPFAIDVGQLPSGDYYVLSQQKITDDWRGFVITRFNAASEVIWSRGITSPGLFSEGVSSMSTFGSVEASDSSFKLLLSAWTRGFTVDLDGDGNYVNSTSYCTIAEINGADTTFQPIHLNGMCKSENGSTTFISLHPPLIIGCSSDGAVTWSKRTSTTHPLVPYEIELLNDGSTLIGGFRDHRAVMAKVSTTGNLEWANAYTSPEYDFGDHGVRSIIQASNEDLFFCAPLDEPFYAHLDWTGAPMTAYTVDPWGIGFPFDLVSSDGTLLKLAGSTFDGAWYEHDMFGILDLTSNSDCTLHQVSLIATPDPSGFTDTSVFRIHTDLTIFPIELALTSIADSVRDGCSVLTAVVETSLPSRFSVFPTLLTNGQTVSITAASDGPASVVLHDALGREMVRKRFQNRIDLPTTGLSPGTYLVDCHEDNVRASVTRIVIQ